MKSLKDKIYENKVDDAIDNTLAMFTTAEDIEALGESFGQKYNSWIGGALEEFLDGVELKVKDDNKKDLIRKLRIEASKIDK